MPIRVVPPLRSWTTIVVSCMVTFCAFGWPLSRNRMTFSVEQTISSSFVRVTGFVPTMPSSPALIPQVVMKLCVPGTMGFPSSRAKTSYTAPRTSSAVPRIPSRPGVLLFGSWNAAPSPSQALPSSTAKSPGVRKILLVLSSVVILKGLSPTMLLGLGSLKLSFTMMVCRLVPFRSSPGQ